jgi:hypothetical protein
MFTDRHPPFAGMSPKPLLFAPRRAIPELFFPASVQVNECLYWRSGQEAGRQHADAPGYAPALPQTVTGDRKRRFGIPVAEGQPDIVWRRIGTHKIFTRP